MSDAITSVQARLQSDHARVLRDMKDGCVDCLADDGYCDAHKSAAEELITNPRGNKEFTAALASAVKRNKLVASQ